MHHPTNHLRGTTGHRRRNARAPAGMLGIVVQQSGCAKLHFPGCLVDRALSTFFSKLSEHCKTPPPFPLLSRSSPHSQFPSSPMTSSRLSRKSGGPWRASAPRRAAPRGTSGGGSLPGWVDGAGRGRARGRGGGSVSAGRSGDQLAGGRAPFAAAALAAAPPPLRVAGWPGGRDSVTGLVAERQLPSRLKWVLPGCCLEGRRGDRGGEGGGGGGGCAALAWRCPRRPESHLFPSSGHGAPGVWRRGRIFSFERFLAKKMHGAFPEDDGFCSP